MGPTTKNQAHQDTFPCMPLCHQARLTQWEGIKAPGTRCPRHHAHDAFVARPSSQPTNPSPSSAAGAPPAPPRRSAPLPAEEEPCSFPSSLSPGELLAFPFASQVIYRAVRQRQLTDIRQVEMPPPACRRVLECRHQGAKFHYCWDI